MNNKRVIDEDGTEVKRYEEGMVEAGEHQIVINGEELPSGIYFYVLQAGGERGTGRLVIVK